MCMRDLRIAPAECRRRGLPAIAVRLAVPDALALERPSDGPVIVTVREPDIGELTIEVFAAGLIIDRDRILEDLADDHARLTPGKTTRLVHVELDGGADGYLAEIDSAGTALPCVSIYVLASPDLAVMGGAIVTVRSALPEWAAGSEMLASLRLGTRDLPANDARGALPVLGRRR